MPRPAIVTGLTAEAKLIEKAFRRTRQAIPALACDGPGPERAQAAAARLVRDGAEILVVTTSNQFTYSTFQDEDKAITDVDEPNDWLEVSGNWTALFLAGDKIVISGSTGNDGTWTIDTVAYQSGSSETRITIVEDLPSAVVDGQVDAYAIFIWAGVEDWFGSLYMGPSAGILAIIKT